MVDAHPKRGKQRPFGKADAAVMRDETLPPQVKLVYAYLTTYCSTKREAWPSRKRIARDTGYDVRTVDSALRVAVDVGLIDVVHEYVNTSGQRVRGSYGESRPGEQTSNRYVLHDDVYVSGKGPGKKLVHRVKDAGQVRVGVVPHHPGGAVRDHPPSGEGPPEVDNGSIPAPRAAIETTTLPSGDAASGAREQVRATPIRIHMPCHLRQPTEVQRGDVEQQLVKAAVRALRERGYEPAGGDGDLFGSVLRENRSIAVTNLRTAMERALNDALTGGKWSHLVEPPF